MKNHVKVFILGSILLSILLSILSIILFMRFVWPILSHYTYYYLNYEIVIPMPKGKDKIYSIHGIDHTAFEIWDYDDSKIEKLIKQSYMTEITEENKDIAMQNYLYNKELFEGIFSNEVENVNLDENFDTNKIISEGNYYALITLGEKDPLFETPIPYNEYMLIYLEMDTHKLYVFEWL